MPWIAGQRLAVRRSMTGATGNIYAGLHEFADMMLVLHFLREGDLFLDIGANVGSYTVIASGACKANTWAFEPDPGTVVALKRNIAINGLGSLATIYELALGGTKGVVPFTVGLDTVNKVANRGETNVRLITQEPLDELVGGSKPVMIKMDVEGYEEDVLRGATTLLSGESLKVIEIETVTPGVSELLVRNHFEMAYYDPFGRKLERAPASIQSNNSVFVRDWLFVRERLKTAKKIKVLGQEI